MSNNPPEKCRKCGGTTFIKQGTYSSLREGEIQMWACKTKGCGKTIRGERLQKLKEVTGDNSTKGALSIAVEHTIKTYKKVK